MAVCLKISGLAVSDIVAYEYPTVNGYAAVLAVDSKNTDPAKCAFVAVSGADYLAFKTPPVVSQPANTMNVTADIFVGAALVLCFALGWIAGGQR